MRIPFIGVSAVHHQLMKQCEAFSQTSWPVLILGETGVGKDVLARWIHAQSSRGSAPYCPVNCAAIPAGLCESEFFGHERGAFSGASHSTRGFFRSANGGTLFLDELGELPLAAQAKLLRALESNEVRSVGASHSESVDIRLISATNRDLFSESVDEPFREDLLERLSVLVLKVPPLRERVEDIAPIGQYLIEKHNLQLWSLPWAAFESYDWPGNVRGLRNFLIRLSVLTPGRVRFRQVQKLLDEERVCHNRKRPSWQRVWEEETFDVIEKELIKARLLRCHGNRKQTAMHLGIAKSTLHEKLRRWRLEDQSEVELRSLG